MLATTNAAIILVLKGTVPTGCTVSKDSDGGDCITLPDGRIAEPFLAWSFRKTTPEVGAPPTELTLKEGDLLGGIVNARMSDGSTPPTLMERPAGFSFREYVEQHVVIQPATIHTTRD